MIHTFHGLAANFPRFFMYGIQQTDKTSISIQAVSAEYQIGGAQFGPEYLE